MLIPYSEIPGVAWNALQRGADEPSLAMHLLTLATVGPDGRPSARLMINRGADRQTGRMWFHTDSHTPKVGELRATPYACVTAWDRAMGLQLRAHGSTVLHQHDDVANRHWEQVSIAARWLYSIPDGNEQLAGEPPDLRLPRDKRQLPHKLTARERERFVVIEMRIETIDWLQATQTEQRRAAMAAAHNWVAEPA